MEEIPLTLRLLAVVGLLAANSFFAAAEVALVSVRESRMRARAKEGDRRARMVVGLLANPDRMLAATQLGVTVASLGLGWASESTVYRAIRPLFEPIFPPQSEGLLHFVSFAIAFTLITFLHMVLGEVVPKHLALERSERLALMVGTPLEMFARASGFFVSIVERSAETISRIFGSQPSGRRKTYSAEELKLLLGVGEGEGVAVGVGEGVTVAVGIAVAVGVGVGVGEGVADGVGVGVAVGAGEGVAAVVAATGAGGAASRSLVQADSNSERPAASRTDSERRAQRTSMVAPPGGPYEVNDSSGAMVPRAARAGGPRGYSVARTR